MAHWLEMVVALLQAQTKDLRELAHIAGADPKTFYLGVNLDELDTVGQDLSGMEFSRPDLSPNSVPEPEVINLVVARVRNASRQEERVAMILDAVLQDRFRGIAVLEAYQFDKAKFATYALDQVRTLLADPQKNLKDELIVAALVPRLFSYTYPLNRGRLLYYLAKYLSKYPQVNEAIKISLNRTASMFVEEYRPRINELLITGTQNSRA